MTESNGSVMRIILLDQNVTVKSSHLRNCEDTDGTEGFGCYRKNLALCHISAELAVCGALQTIESDVARCDVAFEGSLSYLSGRDLAMMNWYFMEQKASFLEQVFPQWKPMKVSFSV